MSVHLQKTIAEKSSSILLTTHVIQNHQVVQSPIKQAQFLLQVLNCSSMRHFPLKPKELPQTQLQAHKVLEANEILRIRGEQVTYFAYDRETGACVGTITATVQSGGMVEITQSVEQTNYEAHYEMLHLMEKSLMEQGGATKIKVRVLDDNKDTIRPHHLSVLGYKVESISHNRILNLDENDYITYVKINPHPVSSQKTPDIRRVCSADAPTHCQDVHLMERSA